MKKLLEKIVTITLTFVSLLFVALLLLLMFKPQYVNSLDNELIKALVIIFTVLFAVLSGVNIYTAFTTNDKLSAVLLFKGKASATKATIGVVKKYVRGAAKTVAGAKITKVQLFVDENNDVRLKANIKIKSDAAVTDLITEVKAVVAETVFGVLGLEFKSLDFTMTGVKNNYKPDKAVIDSKIAAEKEEIAAYLEREKNDSEDSVTEEEKAADNAAGITDIDGTDDTDGVITEDLTDADVPDADNTATETSDSEDAVEDGENPEESQEL